MGVVIDSPSIPQSYWLSGTISELGARAFTQPSLDGYLRLCLGPFRMLPLESRSHHLFPESEQVERDAEARRWCVGGHVTSLSGTREGAAAQPPRPCACLGDAHGASGRSPAPR
ncbi:hypothetical protein GCM10025883_39340 [Mobilicoccus caccae]|uniref:Uncharacterized protein n=1 Tax=Mobilicoccus caccae TaxID=1859295 RepID=A0ABQ6IVB3_9MICO|nr:hypothetical protein GCM10025883_39340 [Mobilicoccus caccae]